jgi:tetratricopeptide (TPR) repeat protein
MVIRHNSYTVLFLSLFLTLTFPGIRQAAADSTHGPRKVKMLRQAVDADPSNPLGWIEMAEVLRLMGYRTEATAALDSALALVKQSSGQEKKQYAIEYSLARAWLDYEQGDWVDGEARADRAVKLGGGLGAHLIAGLNRAGSEIKDKEMRESLGVFYPMDSSTNRKRNWWWAYRTWRHLHNVPYTTPDILGYKADSFKQPDHEVLRWRDRGLVEEANDEDGLAIRAYEKSAEYHPVRDGDWMMRLERDIPGAKAGFPPIPFWVNRDDGYVTGSLLAYQGYCHDRMKAETDPDLRAAWANRVVWAGKAAVHRYPYRPWTRLWRGEAFLELDLFKEAENDITYARSWFEEFGIEEPALNPVDGHIYLLEKNYQGALPLLEQAAVDFPNDASVWADLGLVRIKRLGRDPAREAFDRALELDSSLGVVWHNRGMLNMQDKRFDEALTDLETAAELAPHDPQVTSDLARIKQIIKYKNK